MPGHAFAAVMIEIEQAGIKDFSRFFLYENLEKLSENSHRSAASWSDEEIQTADERK
ncbi:MAG: hypothetical protein QM680_13735 [Luteolibacter sp.]